jgi:hypothetical protein
VNFSGWNTGEPNSGLNPIDQVEDEDLKSEHRLSSSYGATSEDGVRPEEGQLPGNQSRNHPSFLQGSSSNHTAHSINLGMGHISNSSDRGKGKETSSGVNNHNHCELDIEKTSLGSSSFNHIGTPSASSGYMAWGDSGSSSSSLAIGVLLARERPLKEVLCNCVLEEARVPLYNLEMVTGLLILLILMLLEA